MAIEWRWDATFLGDHERLARERIDEALRANDWRDAQLRVQRELCDALDGHRICPLAACRRARRCDSATMACRETLRLPAIEDRDLVEEVYADIQKARRAAAKAADDDAQHER